MHSIKPGRVFMSLGDARGASLQAGDVVLIRDLSKLAPAHVWTEARVRGKWHLRPYQLSDGQSGKLLMVCDFAGDQGPAAVPPEFEVKLDLPGWYAIWFGAPLMQHSANGGSGINMDGTGGGINVALQSDPGYTLIGPDAGRFHGQWAHPFNCEYMCYWKCAQLDKQTLRVRVPWGTYSTAIWGMVRGDFSALRLIRLSDQQAQAYLGDVADPSTKRVMVVNDGFSAYYCYGEPGKGIDAQLAMAYRDTDVGKYLLQTPGTGVASWPSKVTDMPGEALSKDEWKLMREGDRRACDYFQWAVRNEKEGFRVMADVLKGSSTEFHASLRMNLFFQEVGGVYGPFGKMVNGKFWSEHPEVRIPGRLQFNYAKPEVRAFIVGILMELASNYEVSGIDMDFTRWPPIADPARHDFSVLTSFIKEVRGSLNKVQARKGRKLALSAQVADEWYTGGDLAAQKIDLEAWLATGALDCVSVEARNQEKYLSVAKRHGVSYYVSQGRGQVGNFPDEDPALSERGFVGDPLPGDEHVEQGALDKKFGTDVDPTDYYRGFAIRYAQQGVDGVCLTNNFMGWRTVGRMGHIEEVKQLAVTGAIWGQEPGPKMTIS